MSSALLEVRSLHAGYGRLGILHGLDLDVRDGECVTVIGPNGAGKTTLLRVVAGLRPPTAGAVRFAGEHVTRVPTERLVERGLALVPEGRELFSTMSVQDNLLLGAYTRHCRRDPRVNAALERVYATFPRLLERRRQLAGTMSGGEQQMLAVGRALVLEPRLLLLDEPSLGLAPLVVAEIMAVIARLKGQGTSVLLVEQNARAALGVADRAYVLEGGRVALEGTAADLRRDERIAKIYLGVARAEA